MNNIIQWCNTNEGFVSAILSMATLLVSIIAIMISILTARLPYKKKLKLSGSVSYLLPATRPTVSSYNVNVTNIGNRDINVTFLGFAVKSTFDHGNDIQLIHILGVSQDCCGILKPSEIRTMSYPAVKLINDIRQFKGQGKKLYYYISDSEGVVKLKKYISVDDLLRKFGF